MNKSHAAADGTKPPEEWVILTEFAVPGEPGNEEVAVARVAEALEHLHGSRRTGDRVPAALGAALEEAFRRKSHRRAAETLAVRVLIPCEAAERAQESAERRERARQANEGMPGPSGSAHACGFFLVDRITGRGEGEAREATDVYLYPEGRSRDQSAASQDNT